MPEIGGVRGFVPVGPLGGDDHDHDHAVGDAADHGHDHGAVSRLSSGTGKIDLMAQLARSFASSLPDVNGTLTELESTAAKGVGKDAVEDLNELAAKLTPLDENPFEVYTAVGKRELIGNLTPFLDYNRSYRGGPSTVSLKSRASSHALLTQVASSMNRRGELTTGRAVVDRLVDAARNEPHGGLRRHMRLALSALPEKLLTPAQAAAVAELRDTVLPAAPPYEKWFAGEAEPTVNVKAYVQDEFWSKEIAAYKKQGFDVKLARDGKSAEAIKVYQDPKGEAPDTTIKLQIVQQDEHVLDSMSDKDLDVVFYTGHSGVGSVGQWSSERARSSSDEKLVAMFACKTKQNLNQLRGKFENAHVMVSDDGTYGHDDRKVIENLFAGIAKRSSYDQMNHALKKEDLWEGADNYLLPNDTRQLEHADLDRDGRTELSGDRIDLLYNVETKKTRGESMTMRPGRAAHDPKALDGTKVQNGVSWFNTVHAYWAEDFSEWQSEVDQVDAFRADGWFASDDPNEIIRVEEAFTDAGKSVMRVQVNAAYANQDPDAVAMMTTFALSQHIFKETRPDESAYDNRMRALAMAGSYVANLVENEDEANALIESFAKRFGFPQTLTWPVIQKAVKADYDHEASPKTIAMIEKGMQYPFLEVNPANSSVGFREGVRAALDVLKKSNNPLAKVTFDAVVSGRVLVDELADLTKGDFQKVRQEYAREGVTTFAAEDFYDLHDETSRVSRAITHDLDGYMWDNRIYLNNEGGLSPEELASTLVHEVNHILNASEENYRGEASILREEYRAFYAEAAFRGEDVSDPAVCRRIKQGVIDDYGLKGVTPDDVPDVPPGTLIP